VVGANLTVNETENSHRYEHLQTAGRSHFHNRFDRGWMRNALEFWSGDQVGLDTTFLTLYTTFLTLQSCCSQNTVKLMTAGVVHVTNLTPPGRECNPRHRSG
jgi:hypothetical protein